MNNRHDVISAFLDDEPFDPAELLDALSAADGRSLLIDLVALRRIVQPPESHLPASIKHVESRRPWWQVAGAAALLVLSLSGGYLLGERQATTTMAIEAPAPSRTVEAVPFVPTGGM